MGNDKDLEGINIDATVVLVEHATLERADDSTYWRRICPKCEVGTLLVQREYGTFVLSLLDRCDKCGQKFIYRDIVHMRKKDGRPWKKGEDDGEEQVDKYAYQERFHRCE